MFHEAGVAGDMSITNKARDAGHLTQAAVAAGVDVVAAYEGDGTVMKVARGVIGSSVSMGIFPDGTANRMSVKRSRSKAYFEAEQACAS